MQFVLVVLDVLLAYLVVFPEGICGQQHQQQQQQQQHQPSRTLVIDAVAPVPTCAHLVDTEQFYFPNDCVTKCSERDGGGGTFDTDRSRNVNGQLHCYCVDDATPVCTDDPRCVDLAVVPGTAFDNCLNHVCLPKLSTTGEKSPPVVVVTDAIEYATDSTAANKAQTHLRVACSCDEGVTQECGVDSILFSDTNYLPRCTTAVDEKQKNENGVASDGNTLNINSQNDCTTYCTSSSSSFSEGDWKSIELVSSSSTSQQQQQFACICLDKNFFENRKSAVACDDTKANFNDGSGAGTDCYDTVGVNRINCPDASSSSTNYNRNNSHNVVVYTHVLVGVLLFMMS